MRIITCNDTSLINERTKNFREQELSCLILMPNCSASYNYLSLVSTKIQTSQVDTRFSLSIDLKHFVLRMVYQPPPPPPPPPPPDDPPPPPPELEPGGEDDDEILDDIAPRLDAIPDTPFVAKLPPVYHVGT